MSLPSVIERELRTIPNKGRRRRMRKEVRKLMSPRPPDRRKADIERAREEGYDVPNRAMRRGTWKL